MDTALNSPPASETSSARPAALINWLMGVAALVFAMVVVGGITRLTESGLSITEWKPITGTLPPLNEAAWMSEFEKYKQIPEYTQINGPAGMTMAEFKFIYFWEWVHRLLGRVIGLAFALPLAWFWVKQAIPAGYKPRLLALLALGGLQGTIGWWMVSSGLSARTDVSHYRLAVHLLTAFIILGGLVWTALDLKALVEKPIGEASENHRLYGIGFCDPVYPDAFWRMGCRLERGLCVQHLAFDERPAVSGRRRHRQRRFLRVGERPLSHAFRPSLVGVGRGACLDPAVAPRQESRRARVHPLLSTAPLVFRSSWALLPS